MYRMGLTCSLDEMFLSSDNEMSCESPLTPDLVSQGHLLLADRETTFAPMRLISPAVPVLLPTKRRQKEKDFISTTQKSRQAVTGKKLF